MKRAIFPILLMLLPFLASAETIEVEGVWYNLISKGQVAEVTNNPSIDKFSGSSYSGDITIQPSISHGGIEYEVTSIGDYAFYKCANLNSIIIPDCMEKIGIASFYGCSILKSVTLPNNLNTIGDNAFWGCTNMTSVIIPNNVSFIGEGAFGKCSNLISINIPNKVTTIDWYTFNDCICLRSVTLSENLTFIGCGVFRGCSSLETINIPSNVKTIDDTAFFRCTNLTSVIIPNSVTSIGGNAFEDCSSLSILNIPNSVTSIAKEAFYGCIGLTTVNIGNGVKSIGEKAFGKCDKLTDVYCLAEKLRNEEWSGEGLYTYPDAFMDSYPQYMTLHVPAASIEAYSSTVPWSQFKAIVALESGDTPTIQKCATPEISYADGKLTFACETEGAECVATITDPDITTYYGNEITLSQIYTVSVYATKAGYENGSPAYLRGISYTKIMIFPF